VALALVVLSGTLALSLLMVLSICRLKLRARAELAWILAMMAAFALARPEVFAMVGRWLGAPARGARLAALLTLLPEQQLLGNAVLVLWAVFFGRLVSRVIREGKLLLPVAVVASIVDIITVFWGLVAHIQREAPEVLDTFSTRAPVPTPAAIPFPLLSAIGIGDFLFLAVFLSVGVRYAMDASKAMWATFVVMLLAPLAFLIWPQTPGLPGLPFISLAVLGANYRAFSFTRDEKRALAFTGLLVAAITTWVILRR
jgi:hypothetical protein